MLQKVLTVLGGLRMMRRGERVFTRLMESDDCSWVAIGKVKPVTAILIGLTSNNQYKSLVDVCVGRFL